MRILAASIAACCLALLGWAGGAQDTGGSRAHIEGEVGRLAAELAAFCPLADPGDQKAFDACRQALFRGSLLRRSLSTILLWGRLHPKPGESLKDTNLTQFAPEVWTGLYAPMFMFDGSWRVEYDEQERLYRAELGALFRNALEPGQYPYPFWHSQKKWNDYQNANTLLLWIKPDSGSIVVGQFPKRGRLSSHDKVTLVFAKPLHGVVPRVVGLQLGKAQRRLARLDLKAELRGTGTRVVAQRPHWGVAAWPGMPVSLRLRTTWLSSPRRFWPAASLRVARGS